MPSIRLSSEVPVSFRDELERIVFFNPEQERVTAPLLKSVQRYGIPVIVEEGDRLRFRVPSLGMVQTLYALDDEDPASPRLVGVVMFTRENRSTMLILHIATHEDYVVRGVHGDSAVTVRLLGAVRQLCARIHGLTWVRWDYPHVGRLAVRPGKGVRAPRPPRAKRGAVEARPCVL